MAISFKTSPSQESLRDYTMIEKDLDSLAASIRTNHTHLREACSKAVVCKMTKRYLDQFITTGKAPLMSDPRISAMVAQISQSHPNYNLHDVNVGLESVLSDYAKKVTTFAQTMVTTVKQYSSGLFDLFVKKLRINKGIDMTKFVSIDTSMQMIVMKYSDCEEIGNPIADKSENVVKDVQSWFPTVGKIKTLMAANKVDEARSLMVEFCQKVQNSEIASFLKDHQLVEFQFGPGFDNGSEGLNKVDVSERFTKLEESRVLSEAGWTDIDKLKGALVMKNAEAISKNINTLYKVSVDLMDEVRRISNESCVKDPYICAALVKYASLIAQMVNCYTKTFDMCWTTCLRVSQACLIEG